ncbi:Ester hydrolase C11orf54-like, partial [Acipenser ruthenus]
AVNGSYYSTINPADGACLQEKYSEKYSDCDFGLLANLYACEGKPGKVIEVRANRRTGQSSLVTSMRKTLEKQYSDKSVGMGGTFVIQKGKAKIHIMPPEFSACPLLTDEDVNKWLKHFEVRAPLICQPVLVSRDPGLDLRVEHTHCFSHHGEGGHYYIDTTPDSVEYLGYFLPAEFLYRIDRPEDTHVGSIVLPVPPIKVLSKTTASAVSTAAVIHVLESTVIGWIKQVKVVLKHDPLAELQKHGPGAGVYQEETAWEKHIQNLHSLNAQLDSEKAREILTNLEQANSTYAPSFQNVCKDIDKSYQELKSALKICATFRGTYLDVKAKADEINGKKVEENIHHILVQKFNLSLTRAGFRTCYKGVFLMMNYSLLRFWFKQ